MKNAHGRSYCNETDYILPVFGIIARFFVNRYVLCAHFVLISFNGIFYVDIISFTSRTLLGSCNLFYTAKLRGIGQYLD